MKNKIKLLFIITFMFILVGCNSTATTLSNVPDYTKGYIVSSTEEEIKINDTTYQDYLDYITALKTVTYTSYNNDSTKYTDGSNYIEITYTETTDENYDGYNVLIKKYTQKPTTW